MAHVGQERALGPVGGLRLIPRLHEFMRALLNQRFKVLLVLLQFLKRLPQPADDLSHRDGVDKDGLYDDVPGSQWRCHTRERKILLRHFQERKYQCAEQARACCPYGGFVSQEPGGRGWQGYIEQRSRAVHAAVRPGDERRPHPGACEISQTGALEMAAP